MTLRKSLLGVALALGCVAAAAAEGTSPEAEAELARTRLGWVGQALPEVSLSSLRGASMDLRGVEGNWLLLAFTDKVAKAEATAWFQEHARDLAETPGLVVLNVLFPGGVSFLVPRRVAARRIGEEVDRITRKAREGLPEELRPAFDARRLDWHVDWRRELSDRFGAPRHRLALLLADPSGQVVAFEDEVDATAIERLLRRIRLGEAPDVEPTRGEGAPTSSPGSP